MRDRPHFRRLHDSFKPNTEELSLTAVFDIRRCTKRTSEPRLTLLSHTSCV